MKLLVVSGKPLLCLYALRDVEVDEDIRYHYGAGFFFMEKEKVCILNVIASDVLLLCTSYFLSLKNPSLTYKQI